jgi:hypothetical protein
MRRSIGTTSTRDVVHMSEMPNANNAVSLPLTLRTKTSYVKDEPVLSIGEGIAQLVASSAAWSSRVWPAAHDGDRFAPDAGCAFVRAGRELHLVSFVLG